MKKPLTKRQFEVYGQIVQFIDKYGYAPKLKDVADMIGTSNISTAQYFIDELCKKNYFNKDYYKQQGLSLSFAGILPKIIESGKKKIKIDYQTQYIHGIKVVFKDWLPKDVVVTVTSPDEHGLQEVILTKVDEIE